MQKIALASKHPLDLPTYVLPIQMLYPLIRIVEPHFFVEVYESIDKHGLYNPLLVVPRTIPQWEQDLEYDLTINPPPDHETFLVYRVQCGCNRWYALKELEYDAAECYVIDDLVDAQRACGYLRKDKRWRQKVSW